MIYSLLSDDELLYKLKATTENEALLLERLKELLDKTKDDELIKEKALDLIDTLETDLNKLKDVLEGYL